eukprot:3274392-Pyramimonas_sp.AAC.1
MAPPSVALYMCNSRAVSKFSYLAQLSPLPRAIAEWESWASHKILHLPPFSIPLDQLFALRHWSKLRPLSLQAQSVAALIRTARCTVTNWRPLWSRLQKVAESAL